MSDVIDDDQAALDAALAESDQAALDSALAGGEAAPVEERSSKASADQEFAPKRETSPTDYVKAVGYGAGKGLTLGGVDEISGALGGVLGAGTRSITSALQNDPVVSPVVLAAVRKAFPAFANVPDAVINAVIEGAGGETFRRLTGSDPETNPKSFSGPVQAGLTGANAFTDATRQELEQTKEAAPKTFLAGELGGALALGLPGAADKMAAGATGAAISAAERSALAAAAKKAAVAAASKQGAAIGGASGFLNSEGGLDLEGIGNRLSSVPLASLFGGGIGAGVSGLANYAAPAIRNFAESLAARASLGKHLRDIVPDMASLKEYGKFALDNDLIRYFSGPAGIAKRAKSLYESTYPAMNQAFNEAELASPAGLQAEPMMREMVDAAAGGKPYNLDLGQFSGALGITRNMLADAIREGAERNPNVIKRGASDVVGNVSGAFMPAVARITPEEINSVANEAAGSAVTRQALRPSQPIDAPNEFLQSIVSRAMNRSQPELSREVSNVIGGVTAPNELRSFQWNRGKDIKHSLYNNVKWGNFKDAPSESGGNARAAAGAANSELERQIQGVISPDTFAALKGANKTYGMARDIEGASASNAMETAGVGPLDILAPIGAYAAARGLGGSAMSSFIPPLAVAAISRGAKPLLASTGARAADQLSGLLARSSEPLQTMLPALEEGAGSLFATGGDAQRDAFEEFKRSLDPVGRSALGAKAFVESQFGQ